MKRPLKIRILGKQFTVAYLNADHAEWKGEDLYGREDSDRQHLFIRESLPLETEQDTVLHEVIHAVDKAMGGDMGEDAVLKLATGLLAVIKDNPSFVRYLATRNSQPVDNNVPTTNRS